jgi:hypothetical protein
MSEAMWRKDDGMDLQAGATWEMYTEAINRFSGSARSFMEHVHLLTEAWTAYQEAMTVGAELRKRLDTSDEALRSLMGRLEQVVNNHLSEPILDKKRPELVKDDLVRTGNGVTGTSRIFP